MFFQPVLVKQQVMFLKIQVSKGPEVMKDWYRAKLAAETQTFADLFNGAVDKTSPLKDMDKCTLNVNIGQKKTELTHLSPDVSVSGAVCQKCGKR